MAKPNPVKLRQLEAVSRINAGFLASGLDDRIAAELVPAGKDKFAIAIVLPLAGDLLGDIELADIDGPEGWTTPPSMAAATLAVSALNTLIGADIEPTLETALQHGDETHARMKLLEALLDSGLVGEPA